MSKQSGVVSKLRHFVHGAQLIDYYKKASIPLLNTVSLFMHVVVIHHCYRSLLCKKKILKFIYFRKKSDTCEVIFTNHSILSVYELHIYELLKFVLRAFNGLHIESVCNDMFSSHYSEVRRRLSESNLIAQPG